MGRSPPLILVVEDNPDQTQIITHMLRSAGYHVVASCDGATGIRRAKALKPDLILTDLAMPVVSGVQLIEHVRSDPEIRHIPIVAVTAFTWDSIAQAAGTAGVDGFLAKPYSRQDLLAEVEKHVGRN